MRLNIEERAFGDSRLKKLAHIADVPLNQTLGPLCLLWHGSQEALKKIGTRQNILDWCEEYDEQKGTMLFEGLLKSGYISMVGEDQYYIHGNDKQIEGLKRHKAKSAKGGKSTRLKTRSDIATGQGILNQENGKGQSTAEPQVDPCQGHSHSLSHSLSPKEKGKKESSVSEPELEQGKPDADASGPPSIARKWFEKITDFDRRVAKDWMTFAKSKVPSGKFSEIEFQGAIVKMRHEWKMSQPDIESLLAWCQDHDFWNRNAISPVKLLKRKRNEETTKLDTILLQKSQQKLNKRSSEPKTKDADTLYKEKVMKEIAEEQKRRDKEWGINQGGCDDNDPW